MRFDQIVVEHDVDPGGVGPRRDGLARPAERRAIDGHAIQLHHP
jgi:hypothetical protein